MLIKNIFRNVNKISSPGDDILRDYLDAVRNIDGVYFTYGLHDSYLQIEIK